MCVYFMVYDLFIFWKEGYSEENLGKRRGSLRDKIREFFQCKLIDCFVVRIMSLNNVIVFDNLMFQQYNV